MPPEEATVDIDAVVDETCTRGCDRDLLGRATPKACTVAIRVAATSNTKRATTTLGMLDVYVFTIVLETYRQTRSF